MSRHWKAKALAKVARDPLLQRFTWRANMVCGGRYIRMTGTRDGKSFRAVAPIIRAGLGEAASFGAAERDGYNAGAGLAAAWSVYKQDAKERGFLKATPIEIF